MDHNFVLLALGIFSAVLDASEVEDSVGKALNNFSSSADDYSFHTSYSLARCQKLFSDKAVLEEATANFVKRFRLESLRARLERNFTLACKLNDTQRQAPVGSECWHKNLSVTLPSLNRHSFANRSTSGSCKEAVHAFLEKLRYSVRNTDSGANRGVQETETVRQHTNGPQVDAENLRKQVMGNFFALSGAVPFLQRAKKVCSCSDEGQKRLASTKMEKNPCANALSHGLNATLGYKRTAGILVEGFNLSGALPHLSALVEGFVNYDCGLGERKYCKLSPPMTPAELRAIIKNLTSSFALQACRTLFYQDGIRTENLTKMDCSSEVLCKDTLVVLDYVLNDGHVLANATQSYFSTAVKDVCGERGRLGIGVHSRIPDNNVPAFKSTKVCPILCSPEFTCPKPLYVSSAFPDDRHMSFSPERVRYLYTSLLLNNTGLLDMSKTIEDGYHKWCRMSCSAQVIVDRPTHIVLLSLLYLFNLAFLVISSFSMAVLWKNRQRMMRWNNPRHTFLYLNITALYSRLRLVGLLLPGSFVYCNTDGSLVLNQSMDGPLLCFFTAFLTEVDSFAIPLALVWICGVWTNTISRLAKMEKVNSQRCFKPARVLFTLTFIFVPWFGSAAMWYFFDMHLEGHALLKTCTFRLNLASRWVETMPVVGALLVSIIVFFRLTKSLNKLHSRCTECLPTLTAKCKKKLERWRKRHHVLFIASTVCVVWYLSMSVVSFAELSSGQYAKSKAEITKYETCWLSFKCGKKQVCSFPSLAGPHIQYYIQVGIVDCVIAIFTFGWVLFDEIHWPCFHLVKAWLQSWGSCCCRHRRRKEYDEVILRTFHSGCQILPSSPSTEYSRHGSES